MTVGGSPCKMTAGLPASSKPVTILFMPAPLPFEQSWISCAIRLAVVCRRLEPTSHFADVPKTGIEFGITEMPQSAGNADEQTEKQERNADEDPPPARTVGVAKDD